MTVGDRSALNPAVYELKARLCRALGDATRLRIVDALADQSLPVGALCALLDAPQSTVSRHFKVLRDQSLATARHDGSSVWYSLTVGRLVGMLDLLRGVLRTLLDQNTRLAGSLGDEEDAAARPLIPGRVAAFLVVRDAQDAVSAILERPGLTHSQSTWPVSPKESTPSTIRLKTT